MLCLYATWCLLLCLEFTKGVVSVLSMSSLSEVTVVAGRGWEYWGTLRAYCSISKLFGLGRDGVVCGFAFNVLFTKVIVLFCIVV